MVCGVRWGGCAHLCEAMLLPCAPLWHRHAAAVSGTDLGYAATSPQRMPLRSAQTVSRAPSITTAQPGLSLVPTGTNTRCMMLPGGSVAVPCPAHTVSPRLRSGPRRLRDAQYCHSVRRYAHIVVHLDVLRGVLCRHNAWCMVRRAVLYWLFCTEAACGGTSEKEEQCTCAEGYFGADPGSCKVCSYGTGSYSVKSRIYYRVQSFCIGSCGIGSYGVRIMIWYMMIRRSYDHTARDHLQHTLLLGMRRWICCYGIWPYADSRCCNTDLPKRLLLPSVCCYQAEPCTPRVPQTPIRSRYISSRVQYSAGTDLAHVLPAVLRHAAYEPTMGSYALSCTDMAYATTPDLGATSMGQCTCVPGYVGSSADQCKPCPA
eukprot:648123-Rhodomonas_salina.1